MQDVLERLRLLIKAEDLDIADFAAEIEEKPQRIKDILGERQRIPGEVLYKAVERFKVDANWLLLGEGGDKPMYHRPSELMEPVSKQEKVLLNNYRALNNEQSKALELMAKVLAGRSVGP